ncbi:GyrI-like domain-containing protein [Fictibacillus gelatini]|uniref:GyrI-like domain-containing protein n=1 Tax=Fictibacillus gelatini TaxID=225985 RepID=UPI00040EC424|nr:GyrI-like domain-containing protein [Fictibacillus gelatini]
MKPEIFYSEAFHFAGISVQTSNHKEIGAEGEIPTLWEKYFTDKVERNIPHPTSPAVTLGLYSDYESDLHGEYMFSVGKKIKKTDEVPPGMKVKVVPRSTYLVFTTRKGSLSEIVPETWREIWSYFETSERERSYTCDVEWYDERCEDPNDAQIDIYVAVK